MRKKKNLADVLVHGCRGRSTLFRFEPFTEKIRAWVKKRVALEDWQWMDTCFAVEHRYAEELIDSMRGAGFVVAWSDDA